MTTAVDVPGYDPSATCPKCWGEDVGTFYQRERDYMSCVLSTASCPDGEHLHRSCRRCHYKWAEGCV